MPNSSCHFPKRKSVFLQILCDSSVSWKITPLYFFRSNFIYFARKGSTILQFFQCYRIQIHQSLVIFWKKKLVFLSVLRNSCVMKHNSSIPFYLKFYILSTRRAYQSTNMERFNLGSQKSEILHFDELLLSKWYKNSAKKIQKSYLSWHWSVMQNLRKNDLSFQIWHRKFSEFSPNHSKVWTFLFDGFFLVKVYTVWAKKIQRRYLLWHWTVVKNFNKPWPCGLKMARGIGLTFIRALKSWWALWARKFQRNYVLWHWRVLQSLKENWLVAWKMT